MFVTHLQGGDRDKTLLIKYNNNNNTIEQGTVLDIGHTERGGDYNMVQDTL